MTTVGLLDELSSEIDEFDAHEKFSLVENVVSN